MKTLIVVRNPLEVAHSMKERNGTSYSFGLRLWEIYNRRVIEAASEARPVGDPLRFVFRRRRGNCGELWISLVFPTPQ